MQLRWRVQAFAVKSARIEVGVAALGEIAFKRIFIVPVEASGDIDLDNLVVEAEAASLGATRSVEFTLHARNVGRYESKLSWVEFTAPTGVSTPGRVDLGQLAAGAEVELKGTLQYTLGESFNVIADVVDSEGVKSSGTIVVEMEQESAASDLYALSPLVLLLPLVETLLIVRFRRKARRASS